MANVADTDILETGVLGNLVGSLRHVISEKYLFATEHKATPLWKKATSAVVALARPTLEQCSRTDIETNVKAMLWTEMVGVMSAIVKVRGLERIQDHQKIYEDQLYDIECFKSLRKELIPKLGGAEVPDHVRLAYVRALFEASIVHEVERAEIPPENVSPLDNIAHIRSGRVRPIPYSAREKMCYECFNELINLASRQDEAIESQNLARAAAPYLILRLAIPIRAYIADQPLRGRRPQPLSELEELLFCFDTVKAVKLHTDAVQTEEVDVTRASKTAHLRFLYPLLVQAVATAGDPWSGAQDVLVPLQAVLQSLVPFS